MRLSTNFAVISIRPCKGRIHSKKKIVNFHNFGPDPQRFGWIRTYKKKVVNMSKFWDENSQLFFSNEYFPYINLPLTFGPIPVCRYNWAVKSFPRLLLQKTRSWETNLWKKIFYKQLKNLQNSQIMGPLAVFLVSRLKRTDPSSMWVWTQRFIFYILGSDPDVNI